MTAAPLPTDKPSHRTWLIVAGIVATACVLVLTLGGYLLLRPNPQPAARTYFTYAEADIAALRDITPSGSMSVAEAQQWEDRAYTMVEEHRTADVDASKIYAYLMLAQMDAATLSFKAHGSFAGSLGLVSKDVLCEFFADTCRDYLANTDAYAKTLSGIVLTKVKARLAEEAAQNKPVSLRAGSSLWQGPSPQLGIYAPSFKPWFMTKAEQFRAAPPLDPSSTSMKQELQTVKQMLAGATNDQKAVVVKWAGGPGTRTPPGIWLTLAADYMQQRNVPLDKYLETRAILASSMADAVIAVFDSKYFYQYKRPAMFDPSMATIMPTPNHPGYPAGHAAISWAAATVLSAYLPNNKLTWEQQAKEASDSRVIGGIHFPADNAAGAAMGVSVGSEALKKWGQ